MRKIGMVALTLFFVFGFLIPSGFSKEKVTVEGTVICLIPDYQKGTVNPVIANGPCSRMQEHSHLLVSKEGKVYYLQGLEKGLMEIEKNPKRTDVKITGMAEKTAGGWILYVE